ncbi:hypothetical protein ACFYO0_04070 [Streptomyces sp. NPDC006365]|uniref:hypothetical protein n=1 Tax=Streptomyces sp. NPDC006365 TaxID=3364744 RepID=UPI0036B234AE
MGAKDLAAIPASGAAGDLDGNGRTDDGDVRLWISYTRAFPTVQKPPSTVDVQLLSFNDFHGNLEPPTAATPASAPSSIRSPRRSAARSIWRPGWGSSGRAPRPR